MEQRLIYNTAITLVAFSEFSYRAAGSLFKLFLERRDPLRAFIPCDALYPPERDEKIQEPYKDFVSGNGLRPVVERIEVNTA